MSDLPHQLTREVIIRAPRATVFRYFTDSARFAAWWGTGSSIDARPGGPVRIVYPGGVQVTGEVVALQPPESISFTYGYEAQNRDLVPPGGSLVTITLTDHPEGTRLALRHDLATAAARDAHIAGWRYQLALFANVATAEAYGQAGQTVDRYFALWSEPDEARRLAELDAIADAAIVFRDRFGMCLSRADLAAHIGAARQHMPGLTLAREGAYQQCQGIGVADWTASAPDGTVVARGRNLFDLGPDGRLTRIIGVWA